MLRTQLLYLIPYISSLALSLALIIYAWLRKGTRSVRPYIWHMAGQSILVIAYILELLDNNVAGKTFWDGFQWIASSILPVTFLVFVAEYTEQKFRKPKRLLLLAFIVPVVFLGLTATNSLHHLVYQNVYLNSTPPFHELRYQYTPVMYAYTLYGYVLSSIGMAWLIRRFFLLHNLYRAQIAVIILGFLTLAVGSILTLSDFRFILQQDSAPLVAILANLTIAWGFFRFRIFEVAPVGREKVFEAIIDPVVILDQNNTVIDINRSMLDMLGMNADETIGHSVKEVFNNFPIPIKAYAQVSHARVETSFEISGKTVYYELTVWPVYNHRSQMTGRLYISHDITALKELEGELRTLNQDLEKRVQERTQELAEAYDTTLEGWAKALEYRDKETEGHSRRVMGATIKLARALEIPEEQLIHIRRGAILHDIGKMAIPDEILRKKSSLTADELEIVHKHPETALKMLEGIPFLEHALEIPYCHHEKWDGSGYPQGLKERQIPLSARIFAITDVWDALCSDRPYSKPWPKEKVIEYLAGQSGKHFDPEVTRVFLELIERDEI